MPYREYDKRYELTKALRKKRREAGECIQCGVKTLYNPRTKKPFVLCGEEANNCRGANNASALRRHFKKKEEEKEKKQHDNPRSRRRRRV